jgi:SAM-dependent methyltransferase
MNNTPLLSAARTWNNPEESLESVNARIHDGASSEEQLQQRADLYVGGLFDQFPNVDKSRLRTIMEIGSGTGYIMQGMDRRLRRDGYRAERIIGLDIAENMIAKARLRMGEEPPFCFMPYDGLTIPVESESVDLVYSVASLQHVPKLYVYQLFFEIKRILAPTGSAVLHVLSFHHLEEAQAHIPWEVEVRGQIEGLERHWHHYYSADELRAVLGVGTGFAHVDIRDGKSIWLHVAKSGFPQSPRGRR